MKVLREQKGGYTQITLENGSGMTLRLASLGAAIREVRVPDRKGESKTVTLCPIDERAFCDAYYGKTVGRTAGRIAGATFTIGNKTATLEKNNFGQDNLHGGKTGLHVANFSAEIREHAEYTDAVFCYRSPSGEGGYFGNANICVTYRVSERENAFKIPFDGTPDEPTLLNITNHVYWNVSGNLCESAKAQTLYIAASRVGMVNERLLTEKIVPVSEDFDFRTPHKIGDYIAEQEVQQYTNGYDHAWFLDTKNADEKACELYSEKSGIGVQVFTTYPCVVFYANCQAPANQQVYPNVTDEAYLSACLECQYHPDGIHACPERCGVCSPEKPYHEETAYKFIVK